MSAFTEHLFPENLQAEIKDRFHFVDVDPSGQPRLFFENAGGSLRLKAATEAFLSVDAIPDNPERLHAVSQRLAEIQRKGTDDVRCLLNASGGTVYASLTASGAMFDMVRAVAQNAAPGNVVTTVLEHPSAYDAVASYAHQVGREVRVARSNAETGGVDANEIIRLVDGQTTLLCIIYASNISGAKLDLERVVKAARSINPEIFVVVDAVQHAPHGLIDVVSIPVDGINFAPYKFFGCRGSGFSWLSQRLAELPHDRLAAKPNTFWDVGTAAPWQYAVVTAIVDYLCWIGAKYSKATVRRQLMAEGIERIERHERGLLDHLLNGSEARPGLRHVPGISVLLDHKDLSRRDLILSIAFEHLEPAAAVKAYEARGVIVYERVASSLYSKRMLDSFGLAGAVRVSPLHCHSLTDIDRFLEVSEEIARCSASSRTMAQV